MKIGYACLTKGVRETSFKSCILKNATEENLLSIIEHNLNSLEKIIDYNIQNNIKLFRISSDIIPFASNPINRLQWWKIFDDQLHSIGLKAEQSGMRLSMHPGQYTVLNSPKADVVERSIKDLEYHTTFLDSLNLDSENKIILHIGGVYGDKENAIKRFIDNYKILDKRIKQRLVIENDDRCFNIEDVLRISEHLSIPVIFDNLHNRILASNILYDDAYWIEKANKTWRKNDGPQKIHYSQQDNAKRAGAHSSTIKIDEFIIFSEGLNRDIDVMLEVKDKNFSAIKCINAIKGHHIKELELEWSKYKYSVLERSPANYNKIRNLLKDKTQYPVLEFYNLVEDSLEIEENVGNVINAAQHVWGYFKSFASDVEKSRFEKLLTDYKNKKVNKNRIINFLNKLSVKYKIDYLLESYYFSI